MSLSFPLHLYIYFPMEFHFHTQKVSGFFLDWHWPYIRLCFHKIVVFIYQIISIWNYFTMIINFPLFTFQVNLFYHNRTQVFPLNLMFKANSALFWIFQKSLVYLIRWNLDQLEQINHQIIPLFNFFLIYLRFN